MSDELRLGKKGENVDLSKIKGGIRRDDIKDEKLKNIFDKYDRDDNNILSSSEAEDFLKDVKNAAGNSVFSKRETKKFIKNEIGKGQATAEDIWNFTNTLAEVSDAKDLVKSEVNSAGQEVITYEDGSIERVEKDGSSVTQTKDKNGNPVFIHKDKNGNIIQKEYIDANGASVAEHYKTKDGKPELYNKAITQPGGNPSTFIDYRDGEPVKKLVLNGSKSTTYDIVDGQEVKRLEVEKLGNGITRRTEYSKTADGEPVQTIKEDGKPTIVNITQKDNTVRQIIRDENSFTENILNSEGHRLTQDKSVDGKNYHLDYDGQGNTKGIIVQNGETIDEIAKKFGVSKEALIKANPDAVKGSGDGAYFEVGAEIKIPRELEADEKVLRGRASREEAIAQYEADEAKRQEEARKAAEAAAAAAAAAEPTEKSKGAPPPQETDEEADAAADAKRAEENRKNFEEGKKLAEEIYDDIDGIGTSRTFDGHIAEINPDNVAGVVLGYAEKSPDESIAEAIFDEAGMRLQKRKDAVTHIFKQLVAKAEELGIDTSQAKKEFDEAMKLKHGFANNEDFDVIFNSLASAIMGKGNITKAEEREIKNTPETQLQEETIGVLEDIVNGAEESLDAQLKHDGWVADLWEGMKWLFGSDNLDEKVKEDIAEYKDQIAELKSAKTPEEFKTKFKEIFGVNYDPALIKAYQKTQTQYAGAQAAYIMENQFNDQMEDLLKHGNLIGGEKEYNEAFNKLADFVSQGNREQGVKDLNDALKQMGVDENASPREKYAALHKLAKEIHCKPQTAKVMRHLKQKLNTLITRHLVSRTTLQNVSMSTILPSKSVQ